MGSIIRQLRERSRNLKTENKKTSSISPVAIDLALSLGYVVTVPIDMFTGTEGSLTASLTGLRTLLKVAFAVGNSGLGDGTDNVSSESYDINIDNPMPDCDPKTNKNLTGNKKKAQRKLGYCVKVPR